MAQMPQAPRLQTTRRTRFDIAASIGTNRIHCAGKLIRHGNIESATSLAVVFDEPEKWRPVEDNRETMQHFGRQPLFVAFVQQHRVRTVMTTAPACDAIGAVRIRLSFEGWERHEVKR